MNPSSDNTLLTADGVMTWFETPRGILHAVDGVSFTLQRGETLGVVGESGSGKTVLARTIMRLTPSRAHTAGHVTFDGRDLWAMDRDEACSVWGAEISMIFQDPTSSLNPVLRVERQIMETLQFHLKLNRKAARARTVELLSQVGIPEPEQRRRNYPHELSGGMRQRVSIAMAIACSPKLLFADEPTTALDVTIERQILDLLTSLQRQNGMAIVLNTHDLGVVARRADRIMVMYGGQVVEIAPTKVLFRELRHPYTAALLASIPKLDEPSHTRLPVIPGRPVDVIDPKPGCRFAPRCRHAQPRCLDEDPALMPASSPGHSFACFYPVGTPEGQKALEANLAAGRTAAGLEIANSTERAAV